MVGLMDVQEGRPEASGSGCALADSEAFRSFNGPAALARCRWAWPCSHIPSLLLLVQALGKTMPFLSPLNNLTQSLSRDPAMGPRSAPSRQDPQPPGHSVSQVGHLHPGRRAAAWPGGLGWKGMECKPPRRKSAERPLLAPQGGTGVWKVTFAVASLPACTPPSCFPTSASPQDPSFILQEKGLDFDACSCIARVMGGGGGGDGKGQRLGSAASVPSPTRHGW